MKLIHRAARCSDLGEVQNIVQCAYSPYADCIGQKPGPMLDDYKALIEANRVSVIEADGSVQGIIVLIPEKDAMLLDNVAVAPSAQGLGLGRKMIEYAEQCTREAGYSRIRLYTNEAMTRNISYYTRIGYVETYRAEEKGLKRVHMAKTLS
ncbi:acyl-CoA N-acyltransferase [Xylariaceae sp. FL1651]|nr:acyl-CoA N-acyltransferase [Xylariaceae sp. FL1651]